LLIRFLLSVWFVGNKNRWLGVGLCGVEGI
jgi:hypothetical protein